MARYDLEDVAADVERILKAKLTAAVVAVEAEKVAGGKVASGIETVDYSDDSLYFRLAWNDRVNNKKVAIGIFITEHQTDNMGPDIRSTYTVDVGICLSGTENDAVVTVKLLRYMRALMEVFAQNYGRITGCSKETLKTVGPISSFLTDIDSAEPFKIAGITFSGVLG